MKPLSLLIKPAAGLCNMNCRYCFYRSASEKRENRIMEKRTAEVLIEKIGEYNPDSVSFMFQGGEPTLAGLDFFYNFVNSAKKRLKIPVSYALQTNGILIDKDFARFFKENNFLIGVSLDGAGKTNDRYRLDREGKSVFPRILTGISTLKKYGVDFNILSVIDNENAGDIESTYKYFKKKGFNFLQFIPYTGDEGGISLSGENYEKFLKKLFDLWYDDFIHGHYVSIRNFDNYINILLGRAPENCAMSGFCGNYFVIEANGDIYPCDFYCKKEYKTGSIFDEKPFDENERQKKFIDESKLIHPYCEKCKYYILCRGGCKKDRTDDFTKNKYCAAYRGFFDYSAERMAGIARGLRYE